MGVKNINGERSNLIKIIKSLKTSGKNSLAEELRRLITVDDSKPNITRSRNFGVLEFKKQKQN